MPRLAASDSDLGLHCLPRSHLLASDILIFEVALQYKHGFDLGWQWT